MNEWSDNFKISKRAPTDEELAIIEKELSDIDLNTGFEPKIKENLTEKEIEERSKSLTKKELEMIEEMTRIIEDPTYISKVRKRRLAMQESEEEEGISFEDGIYGDGFNSSYGDDFDPQY